MLDGRSLTQDGGPKTNDDETMPRLSAVKCHRILGEDAMDFETTDFCNEKNK